MAAPPRYQAPQDPFDDKDPAAQQLAAGLSVFQADNAGIMEMQTVGNINQAIGPLFQFLRGQDASEMETEVFKAFATAGGSGVSGNARYFLARTALNGRPVLHTEMIYTITLSFKIGHKTDRSKTATQLDFSFDEKTGLPIRIALSVTAYLTEKPATMLISRFDYLRLNLAQTPLPAAAFAWSPPAGAKRLAPPKPRESPSKSGGRTSRNGPQPIASGGRFLLPTCHA